MKIVISNKKAVEGNKVSFQERHFTAQEEKRVTDLEKKVRDMTSFINSMSPQSQATVFRKITAITIATVTTNRIRDRVGHMTAMNIGTDHTALPCRGYRQTGFSREVSTTTDLRVIMADIHCGPRQIVFEELFRGKI